jgi:hypothetical protein
MTRVFRDRRASIFFVSLTIPLMERPWAILSQSRLVF